MVKRLHQYIVITRGATNSALINFCDGNIYSITNDIADEIQGSSDLSKVSIYNDLLKKELIISVDNNTWIPEIEKINEYDEKEEIIIEIDNVSTFTILDNIIEELKISAIHLYNLNYEKKHYRNIDILHKSISFEKCVEQSRVSGQFDHIHLLFYKHNLSNNSCWSNKISVTKDGLIKPCVFSSYIIGDIKNQEIQSILHKAKALWRINKDKIEKCKDCEFRYVCFDCRTIAHNQKGLLMSKSPFCKYNPYKGVFE